MIPFIKNRYHFFMNKNCLHVEKNNKTAIFLIVLFEGEFYERFIKRNKSTY